jgi:indole-3-glycerol phosphate synthase
VSAGASTVLDRIVAETRAEVEHRKRAAGGGPEIPPRRSPPRSFRGALAGEAIAVIAEFKRRSPSAGSLREAPDVAEVVRAYAAGGAAALSVLTEGPNFGGGLEDLGTARAACELPLLRKDFIVDPFQLTEAVAAGADAVLLIVAALDPDELRELHRGARELALDVLVEVHDEHELDVALAAGAEIVGVNNRDLRDFSVDVARTERLMGAIPSGILTVSESGISTPPQLLALQELGVDAALVGEALMRAPDPAGELRALRALVPADTVL